MHLLKVSALSLLAGSAGARYVETQEPDGLVLYPDDSARFLIEYGPGKRRWVSEDDKWEMRRNGQSFMDVTDHQDFGTGLQAEQTKKQAVFPTKPAQKEKVLSLFSSLDKARMMADLDKFTSFYTRYYKSATGKQSSDWLLERVSQIIAESEGRASKDKKHEGAVTAASFPHSWAQSSLIATIPGRTNRTIVIGAHQDSLNQWLPLLRAPGADDDGSGTVTILEVFRVLMAAAADGGGSDLVEGRALNTVEFHWYSAEEAGLLGSADVFHRYHADQRDVRAMLQQDMTGYSRGTLDRGGPDVVGVITDFVDPHLTAFVKMVVDEYCEIGWADTKCGYACSDHASASKAGYPSAFVIESAFEDSNQRIHSTDDLAKHLDFDHMLQHARLTLAFAYELAFTDFDQLKKNDDGRV